MMTVKEMDDKIQEYCDSVDYTYCIGKCPIRGICEEVDADFGNDFPDETREAYKILFGADEWDTDWGTVEDNVNHPKHYCREGGMECIDEMILIFGKQPTMAYCLLNAWKYRYRASDKNGEEDLQKSDWYIRKYKELKEEIDNE